MPFIEDVLPELGDAAFNPATDIKEIFELSGMQPGGGDTFSIDAAEGVLVFIIDWRKARAFIRWCLGFDYADRGYPYRLHRENPQRHPRYPKLYAKTVSLSSVAPKANDQGTGMPLAKSPNYPAVFTDPGSIGKMSYYEACFCTVRYDRPNYDIFSDGYLGNIAQPLADPASELNRNFVGTSQPQVELLTAEGGQAQFVWCETRPAGPGLPGPLITAPDNVVANSFAIRISRTKFLLKLFRWPETYLSRNSFIPFYENIEKCIGKVNSVPFLNLPAGTVRLDAPTVDDRFQYPVSTFNGLGAFFGVNLTIPLTYFNPTNLGVPDTNPNDNNKARGYRVYLHSPTRKWFGIQAQDTSDPLAKWPIEEADLNVIFKHVAAP